MWAYSRIDTVKNPEILSLVRKAGKKWLCLGIESSDKKIRLEVSKGKFDDVDVEKIVSQVHNADIDVMANYMYGLPGDDHESIKNTFNLSLKLCTSGWNTYPAMALPGSQLYKEALNKGIDLPKTYSGYSFHAYDTVCLSTERLKSWEILKYRDEAYIEYHRNPKFLNKIKSRFGQKAVENILEMSKIKLSRKLIKQNHKENKL